MSYIYGAFGVRKLDLSNLQGDLVALKILDANLLPDDNGKKSLYLILRNYRGRELPLVVHGDDASGKFMKRIHAEYPIYDVKHLIGSLVIGILGPNQQGLIGIISFGEFNVSIWPDN
ncbi:MAG: hypothetical protein PHG05_04035 [Candidatus Nanoarchaeia archaeon]|nr:hypothetical protein [Candidatus Nanoarchaeia archaeon]